MRTARVRSGMRLLLLVMLLLLEAGLLLSLAPLCSQQKPPHQPTTMAVVPSRSASVQVFSVSGW